MIHYNSQDGVKFENVGSRKLITYIGGPSDGSQIEHEGFVRTKMFIFDADDNTHYYYLMAIGHSTEYINYFYIHENIENVQVMSMLINGYVSNIKHSLMK